MTNGLVAGYLALMAGMLPLTFDTEKQIQGDVEDLVRKPACHTSRSEMKPDESVGSESLGHLAYYIRRQIFDWPGLASRKVVDYSRNHPEGRSLEQMLEALRPDWLLLRPFELERAQGTGKLDRHGITRWCGSFKAPAVRA